MSPESKDKKTGKSHGQVKTLLDNFFLSQKPFFSMSERMWNPPTDVYETKEEMVIKMEIPGMEKENIKISLEENVLIVSGIRQEDTLEKKENIHLLEIHYGLFQRVFSFPQTIALENITATYKAGFLRICIPKTRSEKRNFSIEIE